MGLRDVGRPKAPKGLGLLSAIIRGNTKGTTTIAEKPVWSSSAVNNFQLPNDAHGDEPPRPSEQCATEVVHKMKDECGAHLGGDVAFDPKCMVAEEDTDQEDHFKCDDFSEGDDDIERLFVGSCPVFVNPVKEPQRDPYVLSAASFAVKEHNKSPDKQLQLVKVVEASKKFGRGVLYDLTMEVAGDEEKLYHARVWLSYGEMELIKFRCVENPVDAVMPAAC